MEKFEQPELESAETIRTNDAIEYQKQLSQMVSFMQDNPDALKAWITLTEYLNTQIEKPTRKDWN